MSAVASPHPRLLLVGGGGGLVGRALLPTLGPTYAIRSVHRSRAANEGAGVEWVPADVRAVRDWRPLLADVDVVINLAWYRWASPDSFESLSRGLVSLIEAAATAGIRRFVHISVPAAPDRMEQDLPYLRCKRAVDRALVSSGLSYRIVRPTMLFGTGDVLLSVMMRLMRRYPWFPMFGDGEYHVSPVAVTDLAEVIRRETESGSSGTVDLGGPERFRYRDLTDRMFLALGKAPRYWRMSPSTARRLTGLLVSLGSTLLYPYEVDWLVSDMLGLPPYEGLDRPLRRVSPHLEGLAASQAKRIRA